MLFHKTNTNCPVYTVNEGVIDVAVNIILNVLIYLFVVQVINVSLEHPQESHCQNVLCIHG
jgi:hypothetical protein